MRILLAINDSQPSTDALQAVLTRPWPKESLFRVISCVRPDWATVVPEAAIGSAFHLDISRKELLAQAARIGEEVVAELTSHGLRAQFVIREEDPVYGIVREAKKWGADLIIVGTHGYLGLKKLLYGSVAQAVVSRAPCSVEVVKRRGKIGIGGKRIKGFDRLSEFGRARFAA